MRPAGRGELESLYFSYPKFDFIRPPEMDGRAGRHQVVVAGAGPVGLTAAIELARRNVRCVLLDRKDTLNDGSRAICISRNSFETLQQLGVVERFEKKALGWTNGRCYYRDKMIYRLEMPHSEQERFLPMYNIEQQYIEQFLVDKVAEFPDLIDLRWLSEVIDVSNRDAEVRLTVDTPQGPYSLQTDYLLAADGARSGIRRMLGLKLNGQNLPGHYVIADIRMNHEFPTERRSFFESEANPDSTILIHRQPDDIWRVDWQLREHEDPVAAVAEENVRGRVQAILNMIGHAGPWDMEWWSIYTANTLCLDDYRQGRVLFIGDSAHIVPIFGVRGLNNGFADAVNAAWKVAYVLNGEAEESLLDTYTPERRGATLDVFENAGKSSRFMTPPSRGYALMRKAVLQLSLTQEFTKKFADPRQVIPYTYGDSPLACFKNRDREFGGGVAVGAAAVNRRIADDDYLLDHLGPGFTGFYFNERDPVPDAIAELARRLKAIDRGFLMLVISSKKLHQKVSGSIVDLQNTIFEGYGAKDGSFYLLRPDRHITARWYSIDAEEVEMALLTTLGRGRI